MNRDARLLEAERVLRSAGVPDARVSAAGPDDEIAAVAASPAERERVAGAAAEIKALGFRYVALDLSAEQSVQTVAE